MNSSDFRYYDFLTEYSGDFGHLIVRVKPEAAVRKYGFCYAIVNNRFYSKEDEYNATLKKHFTEYIEDINNPDIPEDERNYFNSILDILYNQINSYTTIPFKREWMPYFIKNYKKTIYCMSMINPLYHDFFDANKNCIIYFTVKESNISDTIKRGLQNHKIWITKDNDTVSDKLKGITTLDSYINQYGTELMKKIQDSTQPLFTPGQDPYPKEIETFSANAKQAADIIPFTSQKSVIAAAAKNLRKNRSTIIVGEMGTGKTLMSIGTIYAHTHKRYTNNIILCPGHLVEKWKRELSILYPSSQSIICTGLDQFVDEIQPLLDKKTRSNNLFIIISKDTAKTDIEWQPAVKFVLNDKDLRNKWRCPDCGKTFTFSSNLEKESEIFRSKLNNVNINNTFCPHCGAFLWKPKSKAPSEWISFPSYGWINVNLMDIVLRHLRKRKTTKVSLETINNINLYKQDPDQFAPTEYRHYSLARYIYHRYRNRIDYLIADEVHQYAAADSLQGKMFALMVRTARHTIALTGTLMNGYAENLFHLLFRISPRSMIKNGYFYKDKQRFISDYGVTKEEMVEVHDRYGRIHFNRKKKDMPGVSPVVFTKFLMNQCIFVSLEDMSDNLPSYTEIPVGVPMESDLEDTYGDIKEFIRNVLMNDRYEKITDSSKRYQFLMQTMRLLTIYPDQPYNQLPIYDYMNNEVLKEIPSINMDNNRILNKEKEVLELTRNALKRGEHVLIYYAWSNKTNVGPRLKEILADHGYNAEILPASVPAKQREKWIADHIKDGMQVMLCNPALVETGLDLLDFTTIIFYQTGYKLVTMRQAARRSRRLSQLNPVHVYFLYYSNTVQEQALSIMASKLHAAITLEGKFNEAGLAAMDNSFDLLSQLAKDVIEETQHTVDVTTFETSKEDNDLEEHFITRNTDTKQDTTYRMFLPYKKKRGRFPVPEERISVAFANL
jgi:superfamily II DNA or RNA helicase/ribosomal protein S27AE